MAICTPETKIIICGNAGAGKTRIANLMAEILGCTAQDSSMAMLDVIETHLALDYGLEYRTAFDMIEDKVNHREKWAEAIVGFCKENGPSAVADRIYEQQGHRIYIGPRKLAEYNAIREKHKPLAIWVSRPEVFSTPEMELSAFHCDAILDNFDHWSRTVTRTLTMIRKYNLDGSHAIWR